MAISWTINQQVQLRDAVNNFNQKVRRLEKISSGIEREILPSRVSYSEVKNNIFNRQELNRIVNSLKRFSIRGAENPYRTESGEILSNWERRELGIQSRIAQIRIGKEINAFSSPRVGEQFSRVQMGSVDLTQLQRTYDAVKITNIENRVGEALNRTIRRIRNQGRSDVADRRAYTFRENYINTIKNNYQEFDNYEQLLELLESITDPIQFYERIKNYSLGVDLRWISMGGISQAQFNQILLDWGLQPNDTSENMYDNYIEGEF